MEVAITKMSQNGQIVIPAEIRKEARLKAFSKFLVFNQNGNILLKKIESLTEDLKLIDTIDKSEKQIKEGKFVKAYTAMSDKDIDKLLVS
jgi:AbrB family looped-hinge helix DNA binding protein